MLSTTQWTTTDARLDLLFNALSHPVRRSILSRLARGNSHVTELAEPYGISLQAVGKHLRVLEKAGLVHREIDGRVHHCRLTPAPLAAADDWLAGYRHFWSSTLDSPVDHFENLEQ